MKKNLRKIQIIGFVFTGVAGVILHFLYDLTGKNTIAAFFSGVNESIWEHMKLLFFPMFAFAIIEYCIFGKNQKSFWCIKLIGILTGLLLIPMIYYTYTGILGINADWFNIVIFFIAAGVTYFIETLLFKQTFLPCKSPCIAFVVLCVIGLSFMVFTFIQPKIPLFQDPVTLSYGI